MPSRDELTQAWGDVILGQLAPRVKSRLRTGRFTGVEGDTALFALPNAVHAEKSEEVKADAENALSAHFGSRVKLRFVVDSAAGAHQPDLGPPPPPRPPRPGAAPEPEVEEVDIADTVEAKSTSPEQVVLSAFPGAEEVEGQ